MLVDAKSRRLAVGKKTDSVKTGVTRSLDDLLRGARKHASPIAGEFDWGGEEGSRPIVMKPVCRHGIRDLSKSVFSGGGRYNKNAGHRAKYPNKISP